ncbi:MAG: hypothetical protein M3010_10535 [Candidatus Dormibacteraeota bacterium]|nr:hypothetical protein [Candidatus Dormibacteraeota bacterium]
MDASERRLQLWMRIWAPIFAAGGLGFYLLPGMITRSMNTGARAVGLAEAPVDADNLWIVLAAAYMALITAISADAAMTSDRQRRHSLARLLLVGKVSSSLGALGYFAFRRRGYAFLANFLLDGGIAAVTYGLLRDAEAV